MKIVTPVLTSILIAGNLFAGLQEDYDAAKQNYKAAKKEYRAMRYGSDFDKDGEYKKIEEEYAQTVRELSKMRKEHPEMKKLAADEKRLLGEMIKHSPKGEKFDKAKQAYAKHRFALEKKSNSIPEIKALKGKMSDLAKGMDDYVKQWLESNPEAAEAYKRKEELSKVKYELRKKLKAQKK